MINLVKSRDTLLICGDYNAKAEPKNYVIEEIFIKNIGKYGKGELNENIYYNFQIKMIIEQHGKVRNE